MKKSLAYIAALPHAELLDRLRSLPISVLKAFHKQYGIKERDPKSGDKLPLEAHTLMLELLAEGHARPPEPMAPSLVLSPESYAQIMSRREERGEALTHPQDLIRQPRLPDNVARVAHWDSGHGKYTPGEVFNTCAHTDERAAALVLQIRQEEEAA